MPSKERFLSFINAVQNLPHDEVILEFYDENASIRENQSEPKFGRDFLADNERQFLTKADRVVSTPIEPILLDGDHAVVHWKFEFFWKNSTKTVIEEVGIQKWSDDKIWKEQFFYDPKQMVPIKE